MTTTIAVTTDLDPKQLRRVAAQPSPCLTVAIPDYRPGAPEQDQRAILKGLLRQIRQELLAQTPPDQVEALLAPLDKIAATPALEAGGKGWVFFRTSSFFAHHRARVHKPQWAFATRFLLTPFVAEASVPDEYLALCLNTKRLRLFEYGPGKAQEVTWPAVVPASLEAAGQFERGRELLNRTPAGVNFGVGADRETAHAHLHDFFELVDRGLKNIVGARPLILLGVQEEIAAYRHAGKVHSNLIAAEPGSAEFLTLTEIGERAYAAVLREYERAGDAVLGKIREMRDRSRVADTAVQVLAAASQGRIHQLCVRAETELTASTPRGTGLTDADGPVNTAVAETLRAGGDVFVLADRLTAEEPMAAILRY